MADVFKLRQIGVRDEASFGDIIATPTGQTFSTTLPFTDATVTLTHDREADGTVQPRLAERFPGHPGVRRARLEFTQYWYGHLTSPTGALTQTAQNKLLLDGLGNGQTNAAGTTVSAATSASSFTLTTIGNWAAGSIGRVGSSGDGRGNGQAFVVSSVAGSVLTNLTALNAQPNASDVVYGCLTAYHDETKISSLTTKSFLILTATSAAQYVMSGCQLAGLRFNIPLSGGKPTVTFTYEGAYWDRATGYTFPSATVVSAQDCTAVAGGTLFWNDVGTATYQTATPGEMTLTVDLGLAPVQGTGGTAAYQTITAWARSQMHASLQMSVPFATGWETWFDTANASLTYRHLLFTANTVNGRSVGFYMPRVMPAGNRPSFVKNVNGLNYVEIILAAREGATTTSESTRAALKLFAS